MKTVFKFAALLVAVACIKTTGATARVTGNPPHREMILDHDPVKRDSNFYLFLLIGQSNMSGRAPLDPDEKTNPRILMLNKENQWVVAKDPLHFDKPKIAGVGPGLSFAKALLKHLPKGARIGLIPCAWGGSPIRVWQPDSLYLHHHPYDEAIARTKAAMQSGVLSGILWHQGESDNSPQKAARYLDEIRQLVGRLRSDLDAPRVPFIAGEIGYFHKQDYINPVIDKIPSVTPVTSVVSAKGLKDKGDKTHFNTASARELGKRYAKAFLRMTHK
jgi:hypothetical protein